MRDILSASERLLTDKEILEIEEEAKEIKKQNVLYFDTPKTINKMAETIGWVWDKYKKPMLMFLDHSILVQKSAHHNTTTDMLYELGQFWNIIKKFSNFFFYRIFAVVTLRVKNCKINFFNHFKKSH